MMRLTGSLTALVMLAACSSPDERETRITRARLLNESGRASFAKNQLEAAAADFEAALGEAQRTDDLEEKARALNSLGRVEEAQGHYQEAEARYRAALETTDLLSGAHQERFTILLNLGSALGHQERLGESRRACEEALGIAQELEDAWMQALALKFLAVLDRREGNLDKAYERMASAQVQFEMARDHESEAEALYNLGVILEQRGQLKEAMGRYSSAHQFFKMVQNPEGIALSLAAMAKGYEKLSQPRNALVWYRRAADVNLGIPHLGRARDCLQALVRIYQELGTSDDLSEAARITEELAKLESGTA
ncbi:MAG: tetratricopeptide repeat protein [Planctomycetota bacterium]